MAEVIMPKMGDAMDAGVIVQWLKNVGDKVTADDAIAEIETDKSNVEITADADGFLNEIKAQAGENIPVGQVIAVIGAEAGASVAPAAPQSPAPPPATAEAKPAPTADDKTDSKDGTPDKEGDALTQGASGATDGAAPNFTSANGTQTHAPADAPTAAPTIKKMEGFKPYDSYVGALPEGLGGSSSLIGEPVVVEGGSEANGGGEKVKATPLARAMAEAHKLNLSGLQGSGPDGAIGKKDVEAALAGTSGGASEPVAQNAGYGMPSVPDEATQSASQAPTTPATPAAKATPAPAAPVVSEGDEVQEYNAMRRTIAKRLAESKATIPHFYVTVEIDVEAMLKLREQVNSTVGEGGTKITVNDLLVKATAAAIGENPLLNASFADNKRTIKKAVNIGVAVSLADGLIVPVVKNCEMKSIRQIAKETRPLIDKARNGKLGPADYSGGTFTISNLGSLSDVENFAAIVNPGEGAILAIASARQVPAVVNGELAVRRRMKVTLSADHRVVDGSDGAKFLTSLKRIIENPLEILA